MTSGAVVARKSLGRQLKALRIKAGKTQADVSPVASSAKLKRIESGQGARMADVRALCFMYGADTATTDQLVELSLIKDDAWWEQWNDLMPRGFRTYVELEAVARSVCAYDPELILGLLQSPDYHRAVAEAEGWPSVDSVERQVQLRAQRQRAAFERPGPLRVRAVIGEGALCREVGGAKVVAEQRAHLLEMSRRPGIEVQVLPLRAGAHPAMKGAFNVLSFDGPDPDVLYLETMVGGRYVEQAELVDRARRDFDRVRTQSVTIEEYMK